MAALGPVPGEVHYRQLGLGGLSLGESAIIVGPDGRIILVDVGNNSHDDDVRDALDAITAEMRAAGFTQVADRTVDAVILTHHHADHSDGLGDLLGNVTVRGHIIHRGLTDITNAANDATVEALCNTLAAHTTLDRPLCESPMAAPCSPSSWTGTYASTSCNGLARGDLDAAPTEGPSFLRMGTARIALLAANATISGARYEQIVGPLLTEDSNGENGRSVVGVLEHGTFRLLFAGDLTGGGSDTDPVEAFLAERFPDALRAGGVDVLHAGHHGRDTSSSAAWLDVLTPRDGKPRNVVMGISTAHVGSPHASVIAALTDGRLSGGGVFTTRVATGGASGPGVRNADGGTVRVTTLRGGDAYAVQAVRADGTVVDTLRVDSVRACATR